MVRIIPATERAFNDIGWLKTYWLFSFDRYYDPHNLHFGNLRVFNDDTVEPHSGFPTHPHREMEIVTIILNGAITHRDSMGNQTKIRTGEIQRMTAGSGISHSEHNLEDEPLHLYQIWFLPREHGLQPSYEQKLFAAETRKKNILQPVVTGNGTKDTVTIHANATIFLSHFDDGRSLSHTLTQDRGLFLYVTAGQLTVNGQPLNTNDQARIESVDTVEIVAKQNTEFIAIEVEL